MVDIENPSVDHENACCIKLGKKKDKQNFESTDEEESSNVLIDFRDFIVGGNFIRVGVAFLLAVALGGLIRSFVKSFVSPILGIIGAKDIEDLIFTARGSKFRYGLFLDDLLSFLVTCVVAFFVVILPLQRYGPRCVPALKVRTCPYCRSSIPVLANKCSSCTSEVEPTELDSSSQSSAGK